MPLRRADRLFDILRVLRAASRPVTAASLADELEVTVRTVYRDIATLQARRIPIEGAPGMGMYRGALRTAAADVHRGRGRSDCRGSAYARAHRPSGIA
jgi:predicted DNA-binding transcriptional regulator YafY